MIEYNLTTKVIKIPTEKILYCDGSYSFSNADKKTFTKSLMDLFPEFAKGKVFWTECWYTTLTILDDKDRKLTVIFNHYTDCFIS